MEDMDDRMVAMVMVDTTMAMDTEDQDCMEEDTEEENRTRSTATTTMDMVAEGAIMATETTDSKVPTKHISVSSRTFVASFFEQFIFSQ